MPKLLWFFLLGLASFAGFFPTPGIARDLSPYGGSGDCDGFPKIGLKTASGLCVGLVANRLGFARGVAAIGSDIYVVDMGGWRKGHGRLLRLSNLGHNKPEIVLEHLEEPNTILPAPDQTLYISLLGKIIRFFPLTKAVQDIIVNLPADGRHPLPAFAVAPDGSLFVNIGSATDHCEKNDGSPPDAQTPCPETVASPARGSIIHVMPQARPVDARTVKSYAAGLRNSMALTVLPSGQLYAAVNARDAIDQADPSLSDEELPHDTFDIIQEGRDYGWPYCYDDNQPSPEYRRYDCSKKQSPALLLPAHAAPLGMLYYKGHFLTGLEHKLIVAYHGYRAKGHRIVAIGLDKKGAPYSRPIDIITGWNAQPGDHPQGAPVSLFERDDGSILIVEDQNGTLLRISRSSK